jgi:hypothetical protein
MIHTYTTTLLFDTSQYPVMLIYKSMYTMYNNKNLAVSVCIDSVYLCMYVWMDGWMYVLHCMDGWACVCVYVCTVCVCMYVCVCVCVCVYVCMYVCV